MTHEYGYGEENERLLHDVNIPGMFRYKKTTKKKEVNIMHLLSCASVNKGDEVAINILGIPVYRKAGKKKSFFGIPWISKRNGNETHEP